MGNKIKKNFNIIKCDMIGMTSNHKVYLCLIILMLFLYDNFEPIFKFAKEVGYRVTPYLLPFDFTHPFMRIVIFSSVLMHRFLQIFRYSCYRVQGKNAGISHR